MTASIAAESATVLAIGPTVSIDQLRGIPPCRLTLPYVTFRPTTPQSAAGWRTEPPVSPPTAARAIPVARAMAPPLVLPPAIRSSCQGFRALPK